MRDVRVDAGDLIIRIKRDPLVEVLRLQQEL